MKKVLVTGGGGFIGSVVVKKLIKKGYGVRVVDNLSKPGSKQEDGYEFVKVDLTDAEATKKVFKGIDICINLAAKIGGVGYFNKYSGTILSDNNKIYSSTFEAAVANNIERMVYISSSMVYESTTTFPSKEDDIEKIPPPRSAYGFSKLIGEHYCKAFYEQFGLPYSICRPFNAYGPLEYPSTSVGYAHVIPDMTKKMLSGQYPIELLGDGKQVRCFTHVEDLADGIIAVAKSKKTIGKAFNIANPEAVSIIELARLIWQLVGIKKAFKVNYQKGFTYDIKKRIPDITAIQTHTSWKPKITLDKGLRQTVSWLKKNI